MLHSEDDPYGRPHSAGDGDEDRREDPYFLDSSSWLVRYVVETANRLAAEHDPKSAVNEAYDGGLVAYYDAARPQLSDHSDQ